MADYYYETAVKDKKSFLLRIRTWNYQWSYFVDLTVKKSFTLGNYDFYPKWPFNRFQGTSVNVGGGMDPDTGIFTCPLGGSYLFTFHVATHDNKKALLSIRLNGEEVASIFDQNHKDNHKNSMAGNTILLNLKQGDEVCVYAYTGTWLADFPMNHYTHWVGLLLKPSQEEEDNFMKKAEEEVDSGSMIL